jgi:hypothetical protein
VVILPLIDQFDNRLFINPIGCLPPLGGLPKPLGGVGGVSMTFAIKKSIPIVIDFSIQSVLQSYC